MIRNPVLLFALLTITTCSCSEEISIDMKGEQRLVVEGMINDMEGPYFIKVSLTNGSLDYSKMKVTITDNENNIDHLQQLDTTVYDDNYFGYIKYPNYRGGFNTLRNHFSKKLDGIFYTTHICGRVGNIYTLNVCYENFNITATEQMMYVPAVDSIQIRTEYINEKFSKELVPYLFFREPQEQKNYYLFERNLHPIYELGGSAAEIWEYSILDDCFLPEYVNGFNMSVGMTPGGYSTHYFGWISDDTITVRMSSLTEKAYLYYKSLNKQFNNDGGAYSPAPGNQPTNLSSDALGYFRVSATYLYRKQVIKHDPIFPFTPNDD